MKIKSYWRYKKGNWDNKINTYKDVYYTEEEEKILDVELDTDDKPIVRFLGGPTGYESYYFTDVYKKPRPDNKFYMCTGTINSWAECWVKVDDFTEILKVFKAALEKRRD